MSERSQPRPGADIVLRNGATAVAMPGEQTKKVVDILRGGEQPYAPAVPRFDEAPRELAGALEAQPQAHADLVVRDTYSQGLVPVSQTSTELSLVDGVSKALVPRDTTSRDLVPVAKTNGDDERISLVIGGVTEKAEKQSVLVSAEKAFDRGSAEKGGKVRKFLRNIVRHDVGREFLMLRERSKAREVIQDSHRLYDMTEDEWQNLSASSIQRVLDDREVGEMMDVNAGEQQKTLETNEGQALRSTIDQLVAEYVENYEGKYDTAEGKQSLQQEMRRQLAELVKNNPDMEGLLGAGEAYMSNIVDIAEQVRQRVDHEHGVDEILKKVDIITARLDPGARTVLQETKTTKAFDALAKMGGMNGTIIASAAAIGYGIAVVGGKAGLKYGAKVGLGVPILGSAISGVISGFQEKSRLAHERTQVQREEELGYTGAKGTKRREEIKGLLNNMSNATVLTEALRAHKKGEEGHEAYEVTESNFDQLLLAAAGASARRDLSSGKERAFVSYSGETEAENAEERRTLFMETVRARSALRQYYESQGLVTKNGIDFDEFYQTRQNSIQESLLKGAADKDADYSSYSTRRALLKGVVTTGVGLLIGVGMSEGAAFATDKIKGAVEALEHTNFGAQAKTLLAHSIDYINQQVQAAGINIPPVAPPTFKDKGLPEGGNLHIDDRLSFSDNGGTVTVDGPNGLHIDGLQKDPDGTLTQAAQDTLKAANVEYSEAAREIKIPGGDVIHENINDYARERGTRVDRGWWDNNTDKVYEGKPYLEQSLQLSKDSDGNFVYSMKIDEGALAFHGGEDADLKDGTFKMALSMTKESQSTPIILDMERDGDTLKAVIKPNDPLRHMFQARNGNGVDFKGKYAELVQRMGDKDHDGRIDIRSLATDTGPGSVKTIDVPVDSTKTVGDMNIYMKQPVTEPRPGGFVDHGEPMTMFVYPPYRTGLREAGGNEKPREDTKPPEPKPPVDGGGGSLTELELRPRSEVSPAELNNGAPSTGLDVRPRPVNTNETPAPAPVQESGGDAPRSNGDNVRNVNFNDAASNFQGDARARWEQSEAERKKQREENERIRKETEAREWATRQQQEAAAAAARQEQARRAQANANASQQNGGTTVPPQNEAGPNTQDAAPQPEQQPQPRKQQAQPAEATQPTQPEQKPESADEKREKRRVNQENGIADRKNGAPIPEELHLTEAYTGAVTDHENASKLLAKARKDMADAIDRGDNNPEELRDLQKRIDVADARRREARRKMMLINNGRDKEANAQVLAARKQKRAAESAGENKAAA